MTDHLAGSATPDLAPDFLSVLEESAYDMGLTVFNWRQAPQRTIASAMPEIRRFTEWLILTYTIRENVIPRCWWRHPDLQLELSALLHAHDFYYAPTQEVGPVTWHETLERAKHRLAAITAATGCGREGHRDPQGTRSGNELTDIDADDWQQLTGNTNPYVAGHTWPQRAVTKEN